MLLEEEYGGGKSQDLEMIGRILANYQAPSLGIEDQVLGNCEIFYKQNEETQQYHQQQREKKSPKMMYSNCHEKKKDVDNQYKTPQSPIHDLNIQTYDN